MRDSTTKGDFFNGKKFVGEVVHALGVRALVLLGLAKISDIMDHLRIPLVGSNWDWSSRFSLYFALNSDLNMEIYKKDATLRGLTA